MSSMPKIALIGEIFVDYLRYQDRENKLRLGGIVHAARALWSLDIPYVAYHICPNYLHEEVEKFLKHHNCEHVVSIGKVTGSPNVMLVNDPREIGPQEYENLLFDSKKVNLEMNSLRSAIQRDLPTDALIISGEFVLADVLSQIPKHVKVAVDLANGEANFNDLGSSQIEHLFVSTSSALFQQACHGDPRHLISKAFEKEITLLTLKEGRGGSRTYRSSHDNPIRTDAFLSNTLHSVGVGDAFDAAVVGLTHTMEIDTSLPLASLIAAEYAETTYPDDFKKAVTLRTRMSAADAKSLIGTRVPWETRPSKNIYIAAPDFSYVNTSSIDEIASAIAYHNFNPRRPVREHGQASANTTESDKEKLARKDANLLLECDALVAVLIYDDPGTLIEIGIALNAQIPTFIYDPFGIAKNLMLTKLPKIVSKDPGEIINGLFEAMSEAR